MASVSAVLFSPLSACLRAKAPRKQVKQVADVEIHNATGVTVLRAAESQVVFCYCTLGHYYDMASFYAVIVCKQGSCFKSK